MSVMGIKSSRVSARWPRMAIAGCMHNDDCSAFHMMAVGCAMAPVRGHAAVSYETVAWVSRGGGCRSSAGHKGVSVVLPMRDGSPGGSYGSRDGAACTCRGTVINAWAA